MINQSTTPCPVTFETSQGVSVSYKEKFLYSKYNPSRAILQTVEKLNILPGTIFLCCSPVLDYGLKELSSKLPPDCIMLGCEKDSLLYEFSRKNCEEIKNYCLLTKDELYNLPVILLKKNWNFKNGLILSKPGTFRRVIRIDFSAGVQFDSDFYNQLLEACVNSVMTFWTNRVTLTKFGRRYSKNFFTNLKLLSETAPMETFFKTVTKPVLVLGAGESFEKAVPLIKQNSEAFYILCADTALQPLLKLHIVPDGIFIEEAQSVISKAFIGASSAFKNAHLFAGLSSLPQLSCLTDKKNISYFTTLFDDNYFLNNLKEKNLLPSINPPFGSVGLTAVYYALKFRKDDFVPVFCYGLDFSYSSERTHTNGTLAHTNRLLMTNKIRPVENYGAAYNRNTSKLINSAGQEIFTTPVLSKYAYLFNSFFSDTKNLYDAGTTGLSLGLETADEKRITALIKKEENNTKPFLPELEKASFSNDFIFALEAYFSQTRSELLELRKLLTEKTKLTKQQQLSRIQELAEPKEYLYLHFPDGWNFNLSQSFLNRLRIEIDHFLKFI